MNSRRGIDDRSLEEILSRLRRALPESLVLEGVRIGECEDELLPEERRFVERAVPRRRRDFTAGRICARRALARLGIVAPTPVAVGDQREPLWPEGLVGSISHDGDLCLAAVQRAAVIRGVGIDIAKKRRLKIDLIPLICSEHEERNVPTDAELGFSDPYNLIFSIKEAVFKCLFPLVRQQFNFRDVAVELEPAHLAAQVTLLNRRVFGEKPFPLSAAYCVLETYIASAAWIPVVTRNLEDET